jgi:hypothetical protein
MTKRPGWLVASRILTILSIVAIVGVLSFAGLSVYSAAQLRPEPASGPATTATPGPNNTLELQAVVSISNPGYFAVDLLQVSTAVWMPGIAGALLAAGGSPVVSVPAGSVGALTITLSIPINPSVDAELMTHDLLLPGWAWVNATYAQVYAISLTIPRNYSWGAPFANLTTSEGTPTVYGNGTTGIPFEVAFTDAAPFAIDGTVGYLVVDPNGAECGGGTFAIAVGAHSPFEGGSEAYLPEACASSGHSIALRFSGGPWNLPIATEPFP